MPALGVDEIVRAFKEKWCKVETKVAAGSIVKYENRYVFILEKEKNWQKVDGKLLIPYSCPGGGLEEGESIQECLQREALEEISCNLEIVDGRETFYINYEGNMRRIEVDGFPRPLLVYEVMLPQEAASKAGVKVAVLVFAFYSKALGLPAPSKEIPALLLMEPRLYKKSLDMVPLRNIVGEGGKLVEARLIPPDTLTSPSFTAKMAGIYLLDVLEKFL